MLSPGQTFNNRYQIIKELAEGGQSVVYLAQDRSAFNRQVIVKEFKMGSVPLADLPTAIKQFENTASLLAHLNHPNIAEIYEYVTLGNVPYLVTEYVNGKTLEQYLRSSPAGIPEAQVKQWGVQVCDVLSYLHAQTPAIIFRDLKPDNIMLSPTGTIKLIDFGIARTFKVGRVADTELAGTPGYSPPEQYGREQTGPYSDVYALGVTLLRMATGYDPSITPFRLPRADKVQPALSRSFADALACATNLDYHKRFQTTQAFRQAIAPVVKQARAPYLALAAGGLSMAALLALIIVAAIATGLLPGSTTQSATPPGQVNVEASQTLHPSSTGIPTRQPAPVVSPSQAGSSTPDSAATQAAEGTQLVREIYDTVTAEAGLQLPTPASQDTQTPSSVPDGSAIPATSTPATAAPATVTPGGHTTALFSFEQPFTWQRGDQPYGEMLYSTEQAHDGTGSAKITYNFPNVTDDFAVFRNSVALPDGTTGMVTWVYGDGSGHFLNVWVLDSGSEVRQFTFGRIFFSGWRQMVAWFDTSLPWPQAHISGPQKNSLQPPLTFYAIVLDRVGGPNQGAIYVDEVNVTTRQPPAQVTATMSSGGATPIPTQVPSAATVTPVPQPSTLTVCNASMKGISNLCVGQNPVPQGGSTYAIWRIETTFKQGCFDSGDGRGCVGPITTQMRVDLNNVNTARTVVLSWTDENDKLYSDSITVQVQ